MEGKEIDGWIKIAWKQAINYKMEVVKEPAQFNLNYGLGPN